MLMFHTSMCIFIIQKWTWSEQGMRAIRGSWAFYLAQHKNKRLGIGNSIVLVANSHHTFEARSIWSWTRGSSGSTTALIALPWLQWKYNRFPSHLNWEPFCNIAEMFCPESKVSCDQFPYASVSFFITAIWFATQNRKLAELHCHSLAFSLAATFLPQFIFWTRFSLGWKGSCILLGALLSVFRTSQGTRRQ
jgi:hypothetical protein